MKSGGQLAIVATEFERRQVSLFFNNLQSELQRS